jgi:phenylalanyl-tRNA synthetase alpha chain
MADIRRLAESLQDAEISILKSLGKIKKGNINTIASESKLNPDLIRRSILWLSNKELITIKEKSYTLVSLDELGKKYASGKLPEKVFLENIKRPVSLRDYKEASGLNDDEFKYALGYAKRKGFISLVKGVIQITSSGQKQLSKTSLEEQFLNKLKVGDLKLDKLEAQEKYAFDVLYARKKIIKKFPKKEREISLSNLGGKVIIELQSIPTNRIGELTPKVLKSKAWKTKKFRGYDVSAIATPAIGAKKHFVNQALDYARRIWLDMGFKEMTGPMFDSSFWVFDALFTAQDHPVRELQDTFYIKKPAKSKLPNAKLVNAVKDMHEKGGKIKSTGWRYKWDPEDAKKNVLRTHTTCLSARTLSTLKKSDLPAKFFSVGKVFRNETLDWKHHFEFNQTEGIVVDPNANFRHLLGYLSFSSSS